MATYRRRPTAVEAVQVEREKFVETVDGPVKAVRGTWVVTETNGDVHVCDDDVFRKKFELDRPPAGGYR